MSTTYPSYSVVKVVAACPRRLAALGADNWRSSAASIAVAIAYVARSAASQRMYIFHCIEYRCAYLVYCI